ncbi:MAG: DNA mismatch repair protein MutS, partial [Planctomycetes bacterium]|nr:DNA mismatch repair protein MutS [Planctomycetota bacterium]
MMRQYFSAKEQHPHDILFFRMGDFYEMFFDDAVAVSELLGIALTSRSKDRSGDKIPMAGIPVKSVDGYIRRLLEAGRRVAICEQLQDANEVKGIVERGVVRVVTPGTFFDGDNLDDHRPLHLVSLVSTEDEGYGLSWVDLSTGKFFAEDLGTEGSWEEALLRIGPVECLFAEGVRVETSPPLAWIRQSLPRCALTPFPEWHFDLDAGRERLLAHFGTRTLEGFGCEHLRTGLRAAGALIHYLRETQRQALPHITRLVAARSGRFMRLDAATHRALDLIEVARTGDRRGSLLSLLDRTKTAMGARLLREWLCAPLLDREAILTRQTAVRVLVDDDDRRNALRRALAQVRDIERLVSRLPLGRSPNT